MTTLPMTEPPRVYVPDLERWIVEQTQAYFAARRRGDWVSCAAHKLCIAVLMEVANMKQDVSR